MARLFLAIRPSPEVVEHLAKIQERLRTAIRGVRWVAPANRHLTLAFLGEVEEEEERILTGLFKASASKAPCMKLNLQGLGAFPSLTRARVIWAGISGELEPLTGLYKAITAGLDNAFKKFSPHITLGRVKGRPLCGSALKSFKEVPVTPIEWVVREVVLYESTLRPSGPIYTVRRVFPLSPARGGPNGGDLHPGRP